MNRYLISFNDGDMSFPEADLPDVAKAAHAVVQRIRDAGQLVFAGGLGSPRQASVLSTNGALTDGPNPATRDFIGGFTIVEVPTRKEAHEWAAQIAVACRCAQEVRELLPGSAP